MCTYTVVTGIRENKASVVAVLEGTFSIKAVPNMIDDVEIFTTSIEAASQEQAERMAEEMFAPAAEPGEGGLGQPEEPPC